MMRTMKGASAQDEAAWWFARMRSDHGGGAERARFMRWLNGDPAHAAAYAEYEALWSDLSDAAADETIVAMRKEALALAPESRSWHGLAAVAAAFAVFLVAGILLLRALPWDGQAGERVAAPAAQPAESQIYRTATGQRSTVTLADGSTVELNTDSVLQVGFSPGRRDVRLLRGQALFEVAHDSARPFVVEAAGQRITALGTAFDVRVASGEMRVTLIEGRVAVEPVTGERGTTLAAPRILRPGEQLLAAARQPFTVRAADVEQAVSWRTGRVIFSDEPLGDVVEEINRYSERKVVLDDPALADLRVSGVFRTGSVDGFVSALDAAFPVAAREEPARNTIVLSWQ